MKTSQLTLLLSLAASSVAVGVATASEPFLDQRAEGAPVYLVPRGGYPTGEVSGSEIAAYDPLSRRIFVTNGAEVRVDVLDARNLDDIKLDTSIDIVKYGADLQSVAVANGRLAIAIAADPVTAPGKVAILDTRTLREIDVVEVGALPDSVTFTHDGRYLLVANEGEPRCLDTADPTKAVNPEGSVTVIEFAGRSGVKSVRTADFSAFNDRRDELVDAGVRLNWPGATVAQDLEPEYIAAEGNTAWVALQENNAFAVIDIRRATVTDILPLGRKDHSIEGSGLDASDRDGPSGGKAINIQPWPVLGMYMPDSIAAMKRRGATYILSANEGDAREYFKNNDEDQDACFVDVIRARSLRNDVDYDNYTVGDLTFDDLNLTARLGRLNVSTTDGIEGDKYTSLHAFGARSMSIWSADGELVWDSGDAIEQITAQIQEETGKLVFNTNRAALDSWDTRSDDKGPEPEGVAVGSAWGRTYAFVGLERQNGIVVFDVTDPTAPSFVQLIATTDYQGGGDVSPEGLQFVPAGISGGPNPLLVVSYEESGSTRVFELKRN
ncbi:MAG: choice-of-anchor I family protein [Chromatiaceae bacterium]|nr:choice-of-anchor I family protein [Chromatiaceae bacterium]